MTLMTATAIIQPSPAPTSLNSVDSGAAGQASPWENLVVMGQAMNGTKKSGNAYQLSSLQLFT